MIGKVGGASDFTHVTRLDRVSNRKLRTCIILKTALFAASRFVHRSEANTSVVHLSGTFYYSLGQNR